MSHKPFLLIAPFFFYSSLVAMLTPYMPPKIRPDQCTFEERLFISGGPQKRITIITARLNTQETANIGRISFSYTTCKATGAIQKVGTINSLDVNSDYRKRGCGSLLLPYACTHLQRRGCTTALLFASPPQRADLLWLISFYKKFGFTLDTPYFDSPFCMGCTMHKNLYSPEHEQQVAALYRELPFCNDDSYETAP